MTTDKSSDQILDVLEDDGNRLRDRIAMPAWLAPTVGLLVAAWTASPAVGPRNTDAAYLFSAGGVLLALYLAARAAGVRYGRPTARAYVILATASVTVLALYSSSLGLVSLDLHRWVLLPVSISAVTGHLVTRLVEREISARVLRAR